MLEPDAVVERPTGGALGAIEQMRVSGCCRIVTGFLPDELDWPGGGWCELAATFAERMEFRPFLFERAPVAVGVEAVAMVEDSQGSPASRGGARALAAGLADALGAPWFVLEIDGLDDDAICRALDRASLVVNAVDDWSLAFAIDEYAARGERRSIRVNHVAYSPLRMALLRADPLPAPGDGVCAVRPLVSAALKLLRAIPGELDAGPWLTGAQGPGMWRILYERAAFEAYWGSSGWKGSDPGACASEGRWVERPFGWSALSKAWASTVYPRESAERAIGIMTRWVHAERKRHAPAVVMERALPRWVRRHPSWLATYRNHTNSSAEARVHLARWVLGSRKWAGVPFPDEPLLEAAVGELPGDSPEGHAVQVALAWRRDWRELPRLCSTAWIPDAETRAAIAALAWQHCASTSRRSGQDPGLDALFADPALWNHSLGPAAAGMRIVAAARDRRFALARALGRMLLRDGGVRARGGIARIARQALGDLSAAAAWWHELARLDDSEPSAVFSRLVARWLGEFGWHAWRGRLDAGFTRELAVVADLLGQLGGNDRLPHNLKVARAVVAGLSGSPTTARSALERIPRESRIMEGVDHRAAVALWLRGRVDAARAILLESPSTAGGGSGLTAFTAAVAWQVVGDNARAELWLNDLEVRYPQYLADETAADLRWSWGALICRSIGMEARAGHLLAVAARVVPKSIRAFEGKNLAELALAGGWRAFFSDPIR